MDASSSFEDIIATIKRDKPYLIGVAGVPGAGKSYFSSKIKEHLDDAVIVPIDGFHKYRNQLDQEGIRFRGAAFTFNLDLFTKRIQELKKKKIEAEENKEKKYFPILFPSFSHQLKDPIQNKVVVSGSTKHVILQGLYLFMLDLPLDLKIFIKVDLPTSLQKVAQRHFQCGIQNSIQKARARALQNDKRNGQQVLQKSNLTNCLIINNHY